jgi:cytochrome c peroxidase
LLAAAACAVFSASLSAGPLTVPDTVWHLPPGFPRPLVPADNPLSPAKFELGRRLFFDPRLSTTGQYACASCHRPAIAFTDGRARAVGATGENVKHAAMSLANVAYNPAFTWNDPGVRSLEAQMRLPLFRVHPVEMGLQGDARIAIERLRGDAVDRDLFAAAFPGSARPISLDHVIKAIATFERGLISGRSAFDRYVFEDDRTALSESAKLGMALFFSTRTGCAQCHFGINFSGPLVHEGRRQSRALFANTGLYDLDGRGSYPPNDRGLIEATHRAADMGKFRVPTLRNVALTAPYMHDGSVATLGEVIDHYASGGRRCRRADCMGTAKTAVPYRSPWVPPSRQDPRIRPFALSSTERADLIAFLQSLTDCQFVEDSRYR